MKPLSRINKWLKGEGHKEKKELFYSSMVANSQVLKMVERELYLHGQLGLIYIDIVNFTNIEIKYGNKVCKRVLELLKEAILQFSSSNETVKVEIIHNIYGDDYVLYCSIQANSKDRSYCFELIAHKAQELKNYIMNQVNRKLNKIVDEDMNFHVGCSVLCYKSELTVESQVYSAIKQALALAKGEIDLDSGKKIWALKQAIEDKNFIIHYQPIYSLEKGAIIGYEALARGPENSAFQSPLQIFKLAEKANCLLPLERLLRQLALEGASDIKKNQFLFLNCSPQVINDPSFSRGDFRQIVESTGLRTEQIVLEITERHVINDFTHFRKIIDIYRKQGFRFAVDDAGAGYSSLQSIAELQPEYIKIDKSLIEGINNSAVKQALLDTFLSFALKINSHIIAEGIEKEEQLKWLCKAGIHLGQGYLLGRPSPQKKYSESRQIQSLQKQREIENKEKPTTKAVIGSLVENYYFLSAQAPSKKAMEHFHKHRDSYSIVIMEEEKPIGLLMREKLYFHLANQYGQALYSDRPVSLIMDHNPLIVEGHSRLEKVSQLATSRHLSQLYDHIIVCQSGKCIGVVSVRTLLDQLTKAQMELALSANPLTGLPGNVRIEQEIYQKVWKKSSFTSIYIDLDNFKAFNDRYGFERGDQAIKLVADILVSTIAELGHEDDLVGHIGGDDFIIISEAPFLPLCQKIITKFDERIVDFYAPTDRRNGHIYGRDRYGKHKAFPLMSLSLAVLVCPAGRIHHPVELGELAAETKKVAKKIEGSAFVIDDGYLLA
ncbi:GGDEF domain-containing protein [Heliorestis acidaminivorans]|uniref:GGDEF domain-containing protein n=1 Tax=Heliorestis acidaminivorans TaxID=553427 RepID=UPI0014797493|nr:GGDEF domain-containing protein [Heliorestis acidaminivorans]